MLKSLLTGLIVSAGLCAAPVLADGNSLKTELITGFEPFEPPTGDILLEDGTRKTLRDFPGELVLATVWFTTCPGCQLEMPRLKKLAETLKAEGETRIRVLPISIDGVVFRDGPEAAQQRIRNYYERRGLEALPVAIDLQGTNASLLFKPDPVATPTTFLISPRGMLFAVVQGADADWTAPESLAYLRSFLDG